MDIHLLHRAERRARDSPTGVGAVFDRDSSPRDLDGFCWQMVVSDGERGGVINARISGTQAITKYVISVIALQRVVERRAGFFPVESRIEDLLAVGSLVLRSEDFCDSDFEPERTAT